MRLAGIGWASVLCIALGCGDTVSSEVDAGRPDAGRRDGGMDRPDAPPLADAGRDAGEPDGGPPDAGPGFDPGGGEGLVNVRVTFPDLPPIGSAERCFVMTAEAPEAGAEHQPPCTAVTYPHQPPNSGPHYDRWAAYGKYSAAVPWGFLVHNMEHGAVVLFHNCPDGCDEVVAALNDVFDARPADPSCTAVRNRMILAPAPTLDVPIAAAGWRRIYRATCLDLESLRTFVEESYGRAPEDVCSDGVDLSAIGWCPGL